MWGFKAISGSGSTQIDGDFQNIAYVGKITASLPNTGLTTIIVPSHTFVFIGDTSGAYVSLLSDVEYIDDKNKLLMISNIATTFDLFFYKAQPPTPLSGYGLAIFNDSGNLTFNSGDNHLSVIATLSIPSVTTYGQVAVPSLGQVRTLAQLPTPSLRGVRADQGQSLAVVLFLHRGVRVSELQSTVEVGSVSRVGIVGHPINGPPNWSYPTSFASGVSIVIAGQYGVI